MTIDDVAVNFSESSMVALSLVLALIMLGIALDTSPADFRVLRRAPRAAVLALAAQIVLLPAVTFLLTLLLGVQASIALGMILVACCPPGNVSQILTYRSGGNVALSVSLTAVGNALYLVAMPLNIALWGSLHPTGRDILAEVSLDPLEMMLDIVLIIGVPFALGLLVRTRWPAIAARAHRPVHVVSILALVGFVVAALAGNFAVFVAWVGVVLVAVFLHDAVALALGYAAARAGGLAVRERKAVTFEVGIRNAALGLGLVMTFFDGIGGMAVVAGWWGVWDIIAGLALATVWARRTRVRQAQEVSA
ncbi:bile acid:sodium symporter family protein [Isoptericola sediminis]|uniref:Bile acid:sodium symporter family protein n=1 Tax=Isoptericola sediminis TaxID=2733572 RepID=A0A849K8G5_9MICO|nr:bile acid:sodium symporter family protein [Isoptericola sediminis]NNU28760.1 bile acid:sodium symporter family protein [Isoptericola sediminis]